MRKNVALILAGGSGSRLGTQVPKQYLEVAGKPVIAYCLETFASLQEIDFLWVVAQEEWRELIQEWAGEKLRGFSEPGDTRQLSIWNGLNDVLDYLAEDDDMDGKLMAGWTVIIHDAARPLVSTETILACIRGCGEHDGVMPALPVKDTVYYGVDGRIESLLERSKVIAGQAPEAFRLEKYYEANRALFPDRIRQINGSTEPAVLGGLDVQFIPGDERNFKITTQPDLERFQEILRVNHD